MRVEFPTIGEGRLSLPFYEGGKLVFTPSGKYRPEELGGGTVLSVKDNPLAFDHAEIIAQAFLLMLAYDLRKLVFFFLPEKFTLSDYIGVCEYLSREPIEAGNIPNIRRQLTPRRRWRLKSSDT